MPRAKLKANAGVFPGSGFAMALTVKKVARATKPGRYREGSVRGLYLQG
jgi:hypothetical protein